MFIREIILNKLRQVVYPTNNRDIVSNGLIKSINVYDRNLEVVLWQNRVERKIAEELKRNIIQNLHEYRKDYSIRVQFEQTPREMKPIPPLYSQPQAEMFYKLAICSPRGDVFKSLFALNLAAAFAGRNYKVGLIDADLYGPGYSAIKGLESYPRYINRNIFMYEQYGINLISLQKLLDTQSPGLWRGAPFEKCLHHVFSEVKSENLEVLLFDLPPGSGDSLLALIQSIGFDGIILLARASEDYSHCLQKSIHVINDFKIPILGVVAHTAGASHIRRHAKNPKYEFPEKVAHLGDIALDSVYFETNRRNNPILDGDSARFFQNLAEQISGHLYH